MIVQMNNGEIFPCALCLRKGNSIEFAHGCVKVLFLLVAEGAGWCFVAQFL